MSSIYKGPPIYLLQKKNLPHAYRLRWTETTVKNKITNCSKHHGFLAVFEIICQTVEPVQQSRTVFSAQHSTDLKLLPPVKLDLILILKLLYDETLHHLYGHQKHLTTLSAIKKPTYPNVKCM